MQQSVLVPGKIILAGEYAVVFGATGLALPSTLGMQLHYEFSVAPLRIAVTDGGGNFSDQWQSYADDIVCRLASMLQTAFTGSLTIENNIPLGRGMGSSTALIVGLVQCLGCSLVDESRLRQIALALETHYNPRHSGIDFAVIWGQESLLFQKYTEPKPVKLSSDLLTGAVLIDTGQPNEDTATLVQWVQSQKDQPLVQTALGVIGGCAGRLLQGEDRCAVLRDHHRAQVALGVVPRGAQNLIARIEKSGGAAKVIGAGGRTGGGGIVLGYGVPPELLTDHLHWCLS